MVIIPLLCSIAASLACCPSQSAAPNLAPLEASIANLSATMAPPPAPVASFATVAARSPPQPSPSAPQQPPPPTKKGKKSLKKTSTSSSAAQVASASTDSPAPKAPPALPTAARRFFASRTDPLSHPSAQHIIRSFPDIAANALRETNCPFPLSFSVMCNRRGTVTLLANSPYTPASSYSPYFDLLSSRLNQAFPIGDNPFLPFRLAPCETQMVVHSIPTDILPRLKSDLLEVMATTIRNACEVTILDSRFLQPDPEIRLHGSATSVVVTINPDDVPKLGARIRIFSKSCSIRPAHSSSRYSQCRRCLRYGHSQAGCKALHPTCPLCARHHTQSEHRCANLGCPKEGNLRPVPSCCLASPLQCPCCGNQHAAYDRECPARPRPPPSDDQMDTSAPPLPSSNTTPPSFRSTEQTLRQPSPVVDKGKQPAGMPPPRRAPSSAFFDRYTRVGPPGPSTSSSSSSMFRASFTRPGNDEALKAALFNPVPLHPPYPPPQADD